jgi:hypothetical protein
VLLFHPAKITFAGLTFNEVEASHLCCGRTNCYDTFRDAREAFVHEKSRAAEAMTTSPPVHAGGFFLIHQGQQ